MRKFPCPYCKGSGIGEPGETIDVGGGYTQQVSADIECGYCEGQGMITIGSDIHIKRHLENTVLDLLGLMAPKGNWMINTPNQEAFVEDLKSLTKRYLLKLEFTVE